MRGAVVYALKEPLAIEEFDLPDSAPDRCAQLVARGVLALT